MQNQTSDGFLLQDQRFSPSKLPAAGLQVSRIPLPKPLAEALQARRHKLAFAMQPSRSPMRLFEQTGLIFVRVPKNASNSLMSFLYPGVPPTALPHYSAEFYRRVLPDAFSRLPSFAPLRDPMDRVASAFTYYRFTSKKPEERKLMDVDLAFLKSFPDFVHWLNDQPDLSSVPILRWHHFHPQTAYVCDNTGRIIVDLMFPVEDMSAGMQALGRLVGRDPVLDRLNSSRAHAHSGLPLDRLQSYYAEDTVLWQAAMDHKILSSGRIPSVQVF